MTAVKRMNNLKHAFMFQMLHVQLARWQCRTSYISISTRQQMACIIFGTLQIQNHFSFSIFKTICFKYLFILI